MGDWFDDFMVMKILEEEPKTERVKLGLAKTEPVPPAKEGKEEHSEELDELLHELDLLGDEMHALECNEPIDVLSDAYTRWEARRDLLEEQMNEVEAHISELEGWLQ